jgi:hypothetical protein
MDAPVHPTALYPSVAARSRQDRIPVVLAAWIALLTAAPIVQGKLQGLDVVCLLAVPFVLPYAARYGRVRLVVMASVAWLVGQLISDEVNGLGLRMSMQLGTAAAILAIVPVLVFLARGDFRRIRCLLFGVAAGLGLQVILVDQVPLGAPESWKFGLNGPISIGLLAITDLTWRRGKRMPSLFALAAICALGVATDDRHLAGIAALTAILLLFRRGGKRHPKVISVVAGVTLLLAALGAAGVQAAGSGVLGERSGEQIKEFGNSPSSIIVNTRPEPFQEFYLFIKRPVFGWGSHPQLDWEAYLGSKNFLQNIGVVRKDLDDLWLSRDPPGVSAHSQAMDSLARAGLLAIPFWLLFLTFALRAGILAIRFRSSPLVIFWTILMLWDSIFSPLTGLSHIELAAYLAVVVTSLHASRAGANVDSDH